MFIGISNAVTRGENVWGPLGLFANGEAGASWAVLGYSVIGEAITSITDSSGNDISLANAVTAQQPAYDETEDGIKYAFFDLDDSLSATLPDLGTDASKWTVTPYAVHIETGQTIGAGSYTAPTNDWGGHGVIDREVTATEINRLVAWAKRNKLTGVDYPTLKTRMDVICMNAVDVDVDGTRVIVGEATAVKIYDGSDPSLPLEKTFDFSGYTVSSVSALDGTLIVGTGSGVSVLDIDTDTTVAIDYSTATSPAIVNNTVNDVAATVLPDAPIDPATGLPVPTIAVATDGNGTYSTSVITDSGAVYDIASDSTGTAVSVALDGVSLSVVRSDGTVYVWDNVETVTADGVSPDATYSASSTPALLGTVSKVAA